MNAQCRAVLLSLALWAELRVSALTGVGAGRGGAAQLPSSSSSSSSSCSFSPSSLVLTNSILRAAQTSTDERLSRRPAKSPKVQQIQATSADELRANQVIYERKPNIIVCPVSRTSKPMVRVPLCGVWGKGESLDANANATRRLRRP